MGHASARISPGHPLRRLFSELVSTEVPDRELAVYVANLLVDFVHVDQVYRIRDARGKRLEEVGELLVASDPLLEGGSFDREREVRRHIGDYTLFMTGMFPEHVAALPKRGLRLDSLIDYIRTGKNSYRIVGAFDQFEHRHVAPLFRRLADEFEVCVHGLNRVKSRMEAMRDEQYRAWKVSLSER
jgi:hypothetical protein